MRNDRLGLERIVFFTDAVFAAVIALLVLEMRLPAAGGTVAIPPAWALLSQHQTYVTSCLVLGLYWLGYRRYSRVIRRYNQPFVTLHLGLLLGVSLVPFATWLLEDYSQQRSVVIFYGLCLALPGYLKTAIWCYAVQRSRLISPYLSGRRIQQLTWQGLAPPLAFTASIGLATVSVELAKLSWLAAIAAFCLLPVLRLALR
jgi:Endosomal/lysosomal potassium channel TMEM175